MFKQILHFSFIRSSHLLGICLCPSISLILLGCSSQYFILSENPHAFGPLRLFLSCLLCFLLSYCLYLKSICSLAVKTGSTLQGCSSFSAQLDCSPCSIHNSHYCLYGLLCSTGLVPFLFLFQNQCLLLISHLLTACLVDVSCSQHISRFDRPGPP